MKSSKKTIITLIAVLLLTTSIGQAQGFTYTIKTRLCNPTVKGYTINNLNDCMRYFKSIIIKVVPDSENKENNNNQNKPETPKTPEEKPQQPQQPQNPTKPEEKPEQPQQPENPTKPEEKPQQPQQPQNPTKPEEKPQQPQQPQNPTKPEEKPQQPQQPQNPTKPEEQNNSSNTSISSVEREVARLVNLERQKAGLAPLTLSEELSRVARIKSQDMADKNYFSHTSPTYGDPFQMMRSFGIKFGYAGENIAKGYRGAESVMNGWMNSSGHRANILNANFKKIGVGYVEARGTTYWTQLFTD